MELVLKRDKIVPVFFDVCFDVFFVLRSAVLEIEGLHLLDQALLVLCEHPVIVDAAELESDLSPLFPGRQVAPDLVQAQ